LEKTTIKNEKRETKMKKRNFKEYYENEMLCEYVTNWKTIDFSKYSNFKSFYAEYVSERIDMKLNYSGMYPKVGLPLKDINMIYLDEELRLSGGTRYKANKSQVRDAEKIIDAIKVGDHKFLNKMIKKYPKNTKMSTGRTSFVAHDHIKNVLYITSLNALSKIIEAEKELKNIYINQLK
jgi:hypothetical protein